MRSRSASLRWTSQRIWNASSEPSTNATGASTHGNQLVEGHLMKPDRIAEGELEDCEDDRRRAEDRRPLDQLPVIRLMPQRGSIGLAERGLDDLGTDLELPGQLLQWADPPPSRACRPSATLHWRNRNHSSRISSPGYRIRATLKSDQVQMIVRPSRPRCGRRGGWRCCRARPGTRRRPRHHSPVRSPSPGSGSSPAMETRFRRGDRCNVPGPLNHLQAAW